MTPPDSPARRPPTSPDPVASLPPFTRDLADRVHSLVAVACADAGVKAAVEANHDDNRWWPRYVADWRVRMLVAGWSTRVSYAMIDTYAAVVKAADHTGWEQLTGMTDDQVADLVRPLGLPRARVGYLRSLERFLIGQHDHGIDPLTIPAGELIAEFADQVDGASFKVAQCAALYARGYHCGIIPVDSGMVTKLAPLLDLALDKSSRAHETMRLLLQECAHLDADRYRELITDHAYQVTLPGGTPPTWWLHLVLIYFKRQFLGRSPSLRLCRGRPVCPAVLDCAHTPPR